MNFGSANQRSRTVALIQRRGHRDAAPAPPTIGAQAELGPARRPCRCSCALGLHDQPGRAQHARRPSAAPARSPAANTRIVPAAAEAGDVAPEHPALRHRRQQRAGEEQAVPHRLVRVPRLDAEVERHAAQDQADQHHRHRQVQRRQHHAVRLRKGDQQDADAEHQPGFVGVPERADARRPSRPSRRRWRRAAACRHRGRSRRRTT